METQDEKGLILTSRQKWLCEHLDALNEVQKYCPNVAPSSLFCSALYLIQVGTNPGNPDWMAQAAHSLREIMYGMPGRRIPRSILQRLLVSVKSRFGFIDKTKKENWTNLIKTYQEEARAQHLAATLDDLYNVFTQIAHHSSVTTDSQLKKNLKRLGLSTVPPRVDAKIFAQLVDLLERAWHESVPRQLSIHARIDVFLAETPACADKSRLKVMLFNYDARQYFYSTANEQWFDWLWKNGLLNGIKAAQEESGIPELDYLARISGKIPHKVVDFLLGVPISSKSFTTAMLGGLWRICKSLPAVELSRMVDKIHSEKWVSLLGPSNRWFDYEKIFETLCDAKDYKGILTLAGAVLLVRNKDEIIRDTPGIRQDNPFYFDDLIETGVFEALSKIDDSQLLKAVKLAVEILKQIVLLGESGTPEEYFPQRDKVHFYETNLFSLEVGQKTGAFSRDDLIEFMSATATLVKRWIALNKGNDAALQMFYTEDIGILPHSMAMWRFRLYILSLFPEAFKESLREALFSLFLTDHYYEITLGTEYKLSLQKSFHVLTESDRHDYVSKVIQYFTELSVKNTEENKYIKNKGAQILSMIWPHLTVEEQLKAITAEMGVIPNYKPEPAIGEGHGGFVSPQCPTPFGEFQKIPVSEIAEKLQTEWSPVKLREQETVESFLTPRNADGTAQAIKEDMPARLQEYIDNAERFFARDILSSHYTYAYLNSIREVLRESKTDVSRINWKNLLTLLSSIRQSGENKAFKEHKTPDSHNWLAGWDSVHSAMGDVIHELLVEKNLAIRVDFAEYRTNLLTVLAYLLNYEDPIPADEEAETAKIKTQIAGSNYMVSDPLTTAINSVRGRSFEAFVQFVYQDGKDFDKNAPVKINSDVRDLYEVVLKKENTRAIMYMFGHYIPSFYFRQKDWVRGLLPIIFPTDESKKHLYLAAWEGYLATTLYKDIFVDEAFQALYERGVALNEEKDPGRRYRKDPDEGIAGHLALAFVNFEGLDSESRLFQAFWESENRKQQAAFVSFIGRVYVSTENVKNKELLEKQPEIKKKIMDFWDWVLANCKSPEVCRGFGFWVNHERTVFELPWLAHRLKETLVIVKGVIEWDYGLTMILPQLATVAPVDTLAIARLLFLEGGVKNEERRHSFFWDDKCFETLEVLYTDPAAKNGTIALIDDLIREGGSIFWKLKEIIAEPDGSKK